MRRVPFSASIVLVLVLSPNIITFASQVDEYPKSSYRLPSSLSASHPPSPRKAPGQEADAEKTVVSIRPVPAYHKQPSSTIEPEPEELPPLHRAIEHKRINEAIRLINDDADLNLPDAKGFTPLMYAARTGETEMIRLLIRGGTTINTASFSGRTPLIEAVINGHSESVNLLIESGADLNPFLYDGKVPLHGNGATLRSLSKIRKTRLLAGRAVQYSSPGENGMEFLETKMMTATPLEAALGADQGAIFNHLLDTYYTPEHNQAAIDDALRSAILLQSVQTESVALLLKKQAEVNSRSIDGSTPLMHAVYQGKTELATLLLDAGAEVNAVNTHGWTPLLHAVKRGDPKSVTLLLDRGALLSSLPYEKKQSRPVPANRPSMKKGQSGMGKSVVRRKSDRKNAMAPIHFFTVTSYTSDPYLFAVRQNDSPVGKHEQVALLLFEQSTPQPEQIHTSFPRVLKNGWFVLADRLIEHGADVNMDLVPGVSLLNGLVGHHSSGWKNKDQTLSYLCEKGADVNQSDSIKTGYMPLHYAAKRGAVHMAKQLLKYGADINKLSRPTKNSSIQIRGRTPLLVACENNKKEMIDFLLEQGADISSINMTVKPPLFYKKILASPDTLALLLTHGADPNVVNATNHTPLMTAVGKNRDIEAVRLLLEYGADPNHLVTKTHGRFPNNLLTPLKIALKAENLHAGKLLMEYGADIRSASMEGMVVEAMEGKRDELIRFLVHSGAELNEITGPSFKRGYSPLMYSAEIGNTEYLQLLLANGAQTELSNQAGDTALIKAADAGKLASVRLLVEHGAKPSATNKAGLTPFWLAKRRGYEEIADYLAANGANTASYYAFNVKIGVLKTVGIIPAALDAREIGPRELEIYLALIQKQGISDPDSYKPDPRLASPEQTWKVHKEALLSGDLALFKKTLARSDHDLAAIYETIGPEKRQKLVHNMRAIEKITLAGDQAKYRIKREVDGKDITFHIYFSRILGEWKIEDY